MFMWPLFKGTVSLYTPGALLKIEIRHFDGPVFPYMLRAPRQYTSFYLAERVKWKAYRGALFAAS